PSLAAEESSRIAWDRLYHGRVPVIRQIVHASAERPAVSQSAELPFGVEIQSEERRIAREIHGTRNLPKLIHLRVGKSRTQLQRITGRQTLPSRRKITPTHESIRRIPSEAPRIVENLERLIKTHV